MADRTFREVMDRQAALLGGRWEVGPVMGDQHTTPMDARRMIGMVIYDDVTALLDEIQRLREDRGRLHSLLWHLVDECPMGVSQELLDDAAKAVGYDEMGQ